jgi:hypothetical protein
MLQQGLEMVTVAGVMHKLSQPIATQFVERNMEVLHGLPCFTIKVLHWAHTINK